MARLSPSAPQDLLSAGPQRRSGLVSRQRAVRVDRSSRTADLNRQASPMTSNNRRIRLIDRHRQNLLRTTDRTTENRKTTIMTPDIEDRADSFPLRLCPIEKSLTKQTEGDGAGLLMMPVPSATT